MHMAALNGHAEIVQLFLDYGPPGMGWSAEGETPLECAVAKSHIDVVRVFLSWNPNLVHSIVKGHTLLGYAFLAIAPPSMELVKCLVEAGVDVNHPPPLGVDAALHMAVSDISIEKVRVLLDAGADPNIQGSIGNTPLHVAARGYVDIINLLVSRGADIEARDDESSTPLYCAVLEGSADAVKALRKLGADIDARGWEGTTPLMNLCGQCPRHIYRGLVDLVIELGADVNATDIDGWMPLHYAARVGHVDIVEKLLKHGAAVFAADRRGDIPLDLVLAGKPKTYKEVEVLLRRAMDWPV